MMIQHSLTLSIISGIIGAILTWLLFSWKLDNGNRMLYNTIKKYESERKDLELKLLTAQEKISFLTSVTASILLKRGSEAELIYEVAKNPALWVDLELASKQKQWVDLELALKQKQQEKEQ